MKFAPFSLGFLISTAAAQATGGAWWVHAIAIVQMKVVANMPDKKQPGIINSSTCMPFTFNV